MNDDFGEKKHKVFEYVRLKNFISFIIFSKQAISGNMLGEIHPGCQKKDTTKDEWHNEP